MIAALSITILGLLIGVGIAGLTGLRMGGVIVVPLLAVYSLYTFAALPLFLATAAFAYLAVGAIRKHTLIHGRGLLLTSLGVGALVPIGLTVISSLSTLFGSTVEMVFFGTILPGIAAYNYHQLDSEDHRTDIAISVAVLGGLLVFGAALVNPTVATRLDPGLTSILFTPASDIAELRGAVRGSGALTTALPRSGVLVLLAGGLALSEAAGARWGVRLGGLIAIPLMAVLSLTNAWALPIYVVGLGLVYAAIVAINAITLVYGRVLLSLGLVVGMLYGGAVAAMTSIAGGFLLYFTVILAGIGAYNFHRVAPAIRLESIALSSGLFAFTLTITRIAFEPTHRGVLTTVAPRHYGLLLASMVVTGYAVYELDQRRRQVASVHARGVLA